MQMFIEVHEKKIYIYIYIYTCSKVSTNFSLYVFLKSENYNYISDFSNIIELSILWKNNIMNKIFIYLKRSFCVCYFIIVLMEIYSTSNKLTLGV